MNAPGLGESQRSILAGLKRRGTATVPELAGALGLNPETVRDHLRVLVAHGLVRRSGRRASGPGRPEVVYALTEEAELLFPRREAETLRELATYLVESGQERVLRDFLTRGIAARRPQALARVAALSGRARVDEVARIFSELGFMAEVDDAGDGPRLRLCHCPIRSLIDATRLPCVLESRLVAELLGEKSPRTSYIPAGDPACCYEPGA